MSGLWLMLGSFTVGVSYAYVLLVSIMTLDAAELQHSFDTHGVVFYLCLVPSSIPAMFLLSYIIWIGLKIYIHTPHIVNKMD